MVNPFLRKFSSVLGARWLLFSLVTTLLITPCLLYQISFAKQLYQNEPECTGWFASQHWIRSANTFRDTGIWLAMQDKVGNPVPYETLSIADDVGHAFFVALLSKHFDINFSPLKLVYFNAFFNFIGIFISLVFFYKLRLYSIFSALLLMTITYYLYAKCSYSPHYAGLGNVALLSILPLALLAYHFHWCNKRTAIGSIFLGIIFLSVVTLMRSVLGYFGLITGLGILLFMLWKNKFQIKTTLYYSFVALLIIGSWLSPKWLLMVRDRTFSFPQQTNEHQLSVWEGPHGISHCLFIGLGVVPNKWGIEYDDLVGDQFAKRVDPTVVYCSPEYFKILKNLYLQCWKEDPLEVLRIYYKKALLVFRYPPFLLSGLILLYLIGALIWGRQLSQNRDAPMMLLCFLGVGFFFLQGLLAHHDKYYVGPGIFFTCIQCGILLDHLAQTKKFSIWLALKKKNLSEA